MRLRILSVRKLEILHFDTDLRRKEPSEQICGNTFALNTGLCSNQVWCASTCETPVGGYRGTWYRPFFALWYLVPAVFCPVVPGTGRFQPCGTWYRTFSPIWYLFPSSLQIVPFPLHQSYLRISIFILHQIISGMCSPVKLVRYIFLNR